MNTLIPDIDRKFSQTNASEYSGNIWYSKNINHDEQGIQKLSSRTANIFSRDDETNFGYPYSIGRRSLAGSIYITSFRYTIVGSITDDTLSFVNDGTGGNIPTSSNEKRGKWWQNRWYVTNDTTITYRVEGGSWSSTSISLTTGYPHPLEVFRNRTTLCVGNRNVVQQYDTSHATTSLSQLTIPTDYNVIGLAYSNNLMGIATVIDSSLSGQNQEAMFFLWDGASSTAKAGFPVGSDAILAIKAYKGSWIILTRSGKLLYFNGGGFDELVTLPFYFKKYTISSDTVLGDVITIKDNLIYLNFPADLNYYGAKSQRYLENMVGGILCYDPNVGLYHRYSPSISKLYKLSASAVNTTTGSITVSGTIPATGNPILYTSDSSSVIGGLSIGKLYYVIRIDSTHIKLATTKDNANAGTYIVPTSNTTGTFFALNVVDYGFSQAVNTGAVIDMGGQVNIYDHLLFGGYYYDTTLTPKETVCMTVPQFPNIGYVMTPSITSSGMENNTHSINCKYLPIKDGDSIIFKYKERDIIGLPVTTPQRASTCTWTSDTTFTTTADISEAMNFLDDLNELECEITLGAGAGQMSQISSITYLAGTYTVTLADSIDGAVSLLKCNVKIDNWKYIGTIDSNTNEVEKGWQHFDIDSKSKKIKVKYILKGVETGIEELQINNKIQVPSL